MTNVERVDDAGPDGSHEIEEGTDAGGGLSSGVGVVSSQAAEVAGESVVGHGSGGPIGMPLGSLTLSQRPASMVRINVFILLIRSFRRGGRYE